MQLIAYLAFDGTCREAFEFYRDAFGGEIVFLMTVGESPMAAQMPADRRCVPCGRVVSELKAAIVPS